MPNYLLFLGIGTIALGAASIAFKVWYASKSLQLSRDLSLINYALSGNGPLFMGEQLTHKHLDERDAIIWNIETYKARATVARYLSILFFTCGAILLVISFAKKISSVFVSTYIQEPNIDKISKPYSKSTIRPFVVKF